MFGGMNIFSSEWLRQLKTHSIQKPNSSQDCIIFVLLQSIFSEHWAASGKTIFNSTEMLVNIERKPANKNLETWNNSWYAWRFKIRTKVTIFLMFTNQSEGVSFSDWREKCGKMGDFSRQVRLFMWPHPFSQSGAIGMFGVIQNWGGEGVPAVSSREPIYFDRTVWYGDWSRHPLKTGNWESSFWHYKINKS